MMRAGIRCASVAPAMHRPPIGILSGAGPDAGVDMMQKLLKINKERLGSEYKTDRDAPYVVLLQTPGVGGPRGEFDLVQEDQPPYQLVWKSLCQAVENFDRCGVHKFAISCNTLHMLAPKLSAFCGEQKLGVELVSIIDCVEEELRRIGKGKRIAFFGSLPVTDLSGLSPYKRLGGSFNLVQLDKDMRVRIQDLLGHVKRVGPDAEAARELESLVRATEADVFVLGCTELPLLMGQVSIEDSKSLVDPGALLASKLLAE